MNVFFKRKFDAMKISPKKQRRIWLCAMEKIARPVLENLAKGTLKKNLPKNPNPQRAAFAPLEAFGRVSCGILPYLSSEPKSSFEKKLHAEFLELFLRGLDMATNPNSEDFMIFCETQKIRQPLVDATFLCSGLLRFPKIFFVMDSNVKKNLSLALESAAKIVPYNTNWLLFSAIVEAARFKLGFGCDKEKAISCAKKMLGYYKGDGVYGDGVDFHFDYYNSFVIHPMLLDLLQIFPEEFAEEKSKIILRAKRYAEILERMISPEGTYPMVGRSLCYRFGAFHLLSYLASKKMLGKNLAPAQVRCALSSVIQKTMQSPSLFDKSGFLLPGAFGCEPSLAESYINAGSLYLCESVFCALALDEEDEFWSAKNVPWTNRKIYGGGGRIERGLVWLASVVLLRKPRAFCSSHFLSPFAFDPQSAGAKTCS